MGRRPMPPSPGHRANAATPMAAAALGALLALAACGREVPPPSADEPAVLQDYLAISEAIADIAEAHPTDREAAGEAMKALHTERADEHARIVARVRAIYADDVERPVGQRLPNRHPALVKRLEAASKRLAPHLSGEPFLLRDERVRDVLSAVAISEAYAELIRDRWEELGAPPEPE